jgi:ABC-type Fe3+ transport system substrate-binding protein
MGLSRLPPEQVDADGMYATVFALLSPIGYNTNLVNPEGAPRSFADLLDPRWKGKIVKGHPDYSGTILTATFQLGRDLGWSYFEKLAQQCDQRGSDDAARPRGKRRRDRSSRRSGRSRALGETHLGRTITTATLRDSLRPR